MSTVLQDCEQIARDEGLAAGLAAALAGTDVTAVAPGRWAAVPSAAVPAGAPVRRHSLADREDIVFVECPDERPPDVPGAVRVARALAAVRLGVVRRLLDGAVAHLTERTAGDEPLIRKQLVVGAVADVAAGTELLRAYTECQHEAGALADVHNQLDDLGWQVLKLYGAAGYMADHHARALYVSALVGNAWVARGGAAE